MFDKLQRGLFGNWSEFDRMFEEMDRVLRAGHRRVSSCGSIEAKGDSATITVEVPGLDAKDLDVQIDENVLTVVITSKDDETDGKVHLNEFRSLAGNPTYRLPFRVDAKSVKAVCKNGLLTVTLERAQADKPKKIKVLAA
jgi:HSP20 family protein